jgi:SAM-dependent methyltransferase
MLSKLLAHPLTKGLDIDAPETSHLRKRIIKEKRFLRKIYKEWYGFLVEAIPTGEGDVLELGSGGGFFKEFVPDLITSDVFALPEVDMVADATDLPFADGALRAITMTNVLHHLAQPRRFLLEAARCIRPGGVIAMIEPWHTAWSRFIYKRFHHEPFEPAAASWEFPASGPLSGANGALPWMLFERDRPQFEREFPQWRIETLKPTMPFRYLLSGGVSLRCLVPSFTYRFWRWMENRLPMRAFAMFARIVLRRQEVDAGEEECRH